ncbi:hypothetical protein L7F22_041363, partial [Adiantum nelumboides]|nr:hypothetical protein [Adiantum nelumboides]
RHSIWQSIELERLESCAENDLRFLFLENLMVEARKGDLEGAKETFADMVAVGLNPGPRYFDGLVVSYSRSASMHNGRGGLPLGGWRLCATKQRAAAAQNREGPCWHCQKQGGAPSVAGCSSSMQKGREKQGGAPPTVVCSNSMQKKHERGGYRQVGVAGSAATRATELDRSGSGKGRPSLP